MKVRVRVNERGLRIGESHPNARLSDAEVQRLIADRGPEHAPKMTLSALAAKWGLSKSGVKGILDGRRRGQVGPTVDRKPTRKCKVPKVDLRVRVPLHLRAKFHRLGGSKWLALAIKRARIKDCNGT